MNIIALVINFFKKLFKIGPKTIDYTKQRITFNRKTKVISCGDFITFKQFMSSETINPYNLAAWYENYKCNIDPAFSPPYKTALRNKWLSDELGVGPANYCSMIKAVMYKVWIKGKEDLVKTYCIRGGGRVPEKVMLINKHIGFIRAYQKRSLINVLPFAVYFGKTPYELEKLLGKDVWTKLLKNSHSRNKKIAERAQAKDYSGATPTLDIALKRITRLVDVPSSVIGNYDVHESHEYNLEIIERMKRNKMLTKGNGWFVAKMELREEKENHNG